MPGKRINILSTRPLDEGLIEKAGTCNIDIDVHSFIVISKLLTKPILLELEALAVKQATVVFTSMNAVEVVISALPLPNKIPNWKIYCIGGATFTLIKKYWHYDNVAYTAKNAAELAAQIVKDRVPEVIYFCGNNRREELPAILADMQINVHELIVYESAETPVEVDKTYDGVLFFSPSAVHSFFSSNTIATDTVLFAIGNTTANAIKQFSGNIIIKSDFPVKDQLVDKAIAYFGEG